MKLMSTVCALTICAKAYGNDLDVLASTNTPPSEAARLYGALTNSPFESIASQLAAFIKMRSAIPGGESVRCISPQTEHPWDEEQLTKREQVMFTLQQLWGHFLPDDNARKRHIDLLLTLVEDHSLGTARERPLLDIRICLQSSQVNGYAGLPPLGALLRRLEVLARDQKTPALLRQSMVGILWAHGDPDAYLDLAIALTSSEQTMSKRWAVFRECTPAYSYQQAKLSALARYKLLSYGFSLLNDLDDGKSGIGYGLALHLGDHVKTSFAPDMRLPQYRDQSSNLSERYFQETVDNARRWWRENESRYKQDGQPQDGGSSPPPARSVQPTP
jgi:hypothetical protein